MLLFPAVVSLRRAWPLPRVASDALRNLLVAGVCWAVAELTLIPTTTADRMMPMWPAAGVSLAAVWLGGRRLLPGIALGALALATHRAPWILAAIATMGAIWQVIVETAVLRRFAFDARLERVRDPWILALVAAPIGAAILASLVVAAVAFGGNLPLAQNLAEWPLWWMRGWLGTIIGAPLVFAWASPRRIEWTWASVLEATALAAGLVAAGQLLFGRWTLLPGERLSLGFLLFPLLGWAALRFGPRGASTSIALVATSAVPIAALGLGPFERFSTTQTQTLLFLFLSAGSVSGLVLAALMAEREEALKRRLALEGELRHAQKMEAIGRMAGGIAHDFNNVLTAIIGHNEIVLAQLDPTDARRADAEEIGRAALRAASLTGQMLAFSRRQVIEPRVVDLNEVVSGVEPMLRHVIREDIALGIALGASPGLVRIDPGQIEQVIVNLVVNARDAMPAGGRLIVETADVTLDPAVNGAPDGLPPGRYVLLTVSDTGTGMSSDVCARIFEPYFTTKEVGKGTGLGLSTAHGIVRQNGGAIEVRSERGRGTRFSIYLPQTDAPLAAVEQEPETALPRGDEHLLVIEDDQAVRHLTRQILTRLGYSVTEAATGRSGLALGSDATRRLDLVLADVVLGDMSGPAVVEALRTRRPSIRALYMSGYADDVIGRRGAIEEGGAFLQKPFTAMDLARKIREVLEPTGEDARR